MDLSANDQIWDEMCDDLEKCEDERARLRDALNLALELCAEAVPVACQMAPPERCKRLDSDYAILKRMVGEIAASEK